MNNSIVFDKSQFTIVFGRNEFTMHFVLDDRYQCSSTFSREAYKSIPGAWAMAQSLARMGANPHQIRNAVLNIVKTFYEVKIFKTAPMVPAKPARKESPVRTSASEASRHRESDDAGGDDDEDPEPSFLRRIWAAFVAYEHEKHRVLDEFYSSIFNRLAALLMGGAR